MQSDTYDCLGLTEKPKLTHERPPVDVKEEHAVFKPRFSNLHLRPRGPSGDGGRRHVRNCKYPTPDQVAVAQRPRKLMARERRTMLCSPRSGEVSQLNHDLFPDAIRSGGRRLHGSDTAVTHVVSGIHSPRPFSRTRRARSRSIESEQVDSLSFSGCSRSCAYASRDPTAADGDRPIVASVGVVEPCARHGST